MTAPNTTLELDATQGDNFWESATPALREAVTSIASTAEVEQIRESPDALATLDILDQLAGRLQEQGYHDAAERILIHSVAMRQKSPHCGPEDPRTLRTMFELASEQGALGQKAQAEETWRRLLVLYEKVDGQSNLAVMYNLARLLNKTGQFAEAETILRSLLPQLEEGIGRDSQQAIGTLRELAFATGSQGRYEEAKQMIAEGIKILQNCSMSHKDMLTHKKGLEEVGAEFSG